VADTELKSRWVRANGVKTHYVEAGGDQPVLLMLHGGGHGSSGQAGMGLVMRELAGSFRVIAPDSVGGYGETDAYAPTPHGLLDRVKQVGDFADALCLDRFSIMGNSQGAWVAAQYAIQNRDRIEKMVLVASLTIAEALGIKQEPTDAFRALQAYDGTREAMRNLLTALISDKSRITDALIDQRQANATRPGAMEAMDAFLKNTGAVRRDPVLALQTDMKTSLPLATEHIPTIFVWGLEDTFALPESGRAVEKLLPKVKFHWVAGGGHQVQTDKAPEVAALIRAFMGVK
jgi:pimeloyl-ACP methyl ester carboxylesterase